MKPRKKALLSKVALILVGALLASAASAEEIELKYFKPAYGNVASIQRGARDFVAYCSGCHSMKYMRYSRLETDLGIPEDLLKTSLMIGTDKLGDTMKSAMPASSAKTWFGQVPPDLTLEARARGADWIYTYLQSFYVDEKRPLGVNNIVLPNVSMPNVLWELQGWQKRVEHKADEPAAAAEADKAKAEGEEHHGPQFEPLTQGKMTPDEYRAFVTDITNFMAYAAEPAKATRIGLGFKVLVYLFLLLVLTYLLKKEFWKDVH
jgi:ubiquinol-cytochrome c reductase cytochrome c1 subunit